MLSLEEKYNKWYLLYWGHFVITGDASLPGRNIPFENMDLASGYGEVGDGTINIAEMMQLIHVMKLRGFDAPVSMMDALRTIGRLQQSAYKYYQGKFTNFSIPEYWFLLRDDIDPEDKETLSSIGLGSVKGCYGMLTTNAYEDPCWGSFESQDQIWNLNPMLSEVMLSGTLYGQEASVLAGQIGFGLNSYLSTNGYTLYDPYLSYIKHRITYCPPFDMSVQERLMDREDEFTPDIKVKRGANNWYYSGGTSACTDTFSTGHEGYDGTLRTFLYKQVVFFLDRIWEPLLNLFGKTFKHNAINCYAATSGIWYNSKFVSRTVKRLNKSLEKGGEIYNANTSFLVAGRSEEKVDLDLLEKWLEDYPEPDDTKMQYTSPVQFLYIYNWFKLWESQ